MMDRTRIIDGGNRISGLVSVIMPSFNTEKYINDSIDSVLGQTYNNFELIIVDDCSSDNSVDIIKKYDDPRIKLIVNKRNKGAAFSRNRALIESKGEWIAFLDSDDIWEPKKLEEQIRFMLDLECWFSYTDYREFKDNVNNCSAIVSGPDRISKIDMYKYCWPGCLTVMYNAKKIGIVQVSLISKNNDYAMWLCLVKYSNCLRVKEILANYRKSRKGSISSDNIIKLIKSHYTLYRQSEGLGVFYSIFHCMINLIYGVIKKIFYRKLQKSHRIEI